MQWSRVWMILILHGRQYFSLLSADIVCVCRTVPPSWYKPTGLILDIWIRLNSLFSRSRLILENISLKKIILVHSHFYFCCRLHFRVALSLRSSSFFGLYSFFGLTLFFICSSKINYFKSCWDLHTLLFSSCLPV